MLLLASRSPQRRALLAAAGIPFRVVDGEVDEDAILADDPESLALARAQAKTRAVPAAAIAADDVVLGADTVVAIGSAVFGKPRDDADARRMLRALSGCAQRVITGHCLRRADGREAAAVAETVVTMRPLSEAEIAAYVASGESRGRAGAYAIQESGDRFVARLDGDFDTVVGLSVASLCRSYRELTGQELR